MDTGTYRFADLASNPDLLHDISKLEAKMLDRLGQEITLIAYSQDEPAAPNNTQEEHVP